MASIISKLAKLPQSQEEIPGKNRSTKDEATQCSYMKRNPRDFWQQKFKKFNYSGLSVRKFCTLHGVAHSTFYAWKHRFTAEKRDLLPCKKEEVPEFVSVLLDPSKKELFQDFPPQESLKPQSITLHLNEKLHLAIPKDFDGHTLERVVQILSGQY